MRRQGGSPGVPGKVEGTWDAIVYGGILLALLLLNALPGFGYEEIGLLRCPEATQNAVSAKFLLIMYACMSAGIALDTGLSGQYRAPLRLALLLGGISAAGSLTGMLCNAAACAGSSSGIVFTISGVSGIVLVATISVLALGEKPNVFWVASVALGLATVLLGKG